MRSCRSPQPVLFPIKMVYTRWKCDRYLFYAPKFLLQDYPGAFFGYMFTAAVMWKYTSFCSEETERRNLYYTGYPYWRDPIAKRNEDKYKRLIRDNDIDITDTKWTGVAKSALQ